MTLARQGKPTKRPAASNNKKTSKKKGLIERIRDRDSLAATNLRFLWLVHWDLSGRDLRAANLRGAQLMGADLSASDLSGAILEAANLTGASLRGTILTDANLRDVIVQNADFRTARGLNKTTLRALQARGAIV